MEDNVVNVIKMINDGVPFMMSVSTPRVTISAGRRFVIAHLRLATSLGFGGNEPICTFIKTGVDHCEVIYTEDEKGEPSQITLYYGGQPVIDFTFGELVQEQSLRVLKFCEQLSAVLKKESQPE